MNKVLTNTVLMLNTCVVHIKCYQNAVIGEAIVTFLAVLVRIYSISTPNRSSYKLCSRSHNHKNSPYPEQDSSYYPSKIRQLFYVKSLNFINIQPLFK